MTGQFVLFNRMMCRGPRAVVTCALLALSLAAHAQGEIGTVPESELLRSWAVHGVSDHTCEPLMQQIPGPCSSGGAALEAVPGSRPESPEPSVSDRKDRDLQDWLILLWPRIGHVIVAVLILLSAYVSACRFGRGNNSARTATGKPHWRGPLDERLLTTGAVALFIAVVLVLSKAAMHPINDVNGTLVQTFVAILALVGLLNFAWHFKMQQDAHREFRELKGQNQEEIQKMEKDLERKLENEMRDRLGEIESDLASMAAQQVQDALEQFKSAR